jgi:hypothetical protein
MSSAWQDDVEGTDASPLAAKGEDEVGSPQHVGGHLPCHESVGIAAAPAQAWPGRCGDRRSQDGGGTSTFDRHGRPQPGRQETLVGGWAALVAGTDGQDMKCRALVSWGSSCVGDPASS